MCAPLKAMSFGWCKACIGKPRSAWALCLWMLLSFRANRLICIHIVLDRTPMGFRVFVFDKCIWLVSFSLYCQNRLGSGVFFQILIVSRSLWIFWMYQARRRGRPSLHLLALHPSKILHQGTRIFGGLVEGELRKSSGMVRMPIINFREYS